MAKPIISMMPLSVVCLNWNNYLDRGNLYVNRLWSMLDRHLTIPHEFIVVTEHDHDLPFGRVGWWNKLSLLNMFDGEVLYLDLDIVISGNIDHLVKLACPRSKLWARNDWSYPVSENSRIVGDGYAGPLMENGREATINSSVMYWWGRREIPQREGVHGDQGCITAALWPDDGIRLFPNEWIKSYKYDYQQGRGYRPITVFHGEPKPHDVDAPFVREHWR
jgi:hypothetical protein